MGVLLRRIALDSLMFSTWFALCGAAGAEGVIDMGGMSDQEAKSHFKVGKSLYETGRFSVAAVEFEKAYTLQLQNFAQNVLQDKPAPITIDDGMEALRVGVAGTRARETGTTVTVAGITA